MDTIFRIRKTREMLEKEKREKQKNMTEDEIFNDELRKLQE